MILSRLEELEPRQLPAVTPAKPNNLHIDRNPNPVTPKVGDEKELDAFSDLFETEVTPYVRNRSTGVVKPEFAFLDLSGPQGARDGKMTEHDTAEANKLIAQRVVQLLNGPAVRDGNRTIRLGSLIQVRQMPDVRMKDGKVVPDSTGFPANPDALKLINTNDADFRYVMFVSGSTRNPIIDPATGQPKPRRVTGVTAQGPVGYNNETVAYAFGEKWVEFYGAVNRASINQGEGPARTSVEFLAAMGNTIVREFLHLLGVGHTFEPGTAAAAIVTKNGRQVIGQNGLPVLNPGWERLTTATGVTYRHQNPTSPNTIVAQPGTTATSQRVVQNVMNYRSSGNPRAAFIPGYTVKWTKTYQPRTDSDGDIVRGTVDYGPQTPVIEAFKSLKPGSTQHAHSQEYLFLDPEDELPTLEPPPTELPAPTAGTVGATTPATLASTFTACMTSVISDLVGTYTAALDLPAGSLPLMAANVSSMLGLNQVLKATAAAPDLAGVTTMAQLSSRLSTAGFNLDLLPTNSRFAALPKNSAADLLRARIAFPPADAFGSTVPTTGTLDALKSSGVTISGSLDLRAGLAV